MQEGDSNIIKGIHIPKAYTALSGTELHERREELGDRIRWFKNNYAFVPNEEDAEFRKFTDQCKEDTKALRRALQKEFNDRKVKIWASANKRPKNKKEYQRLSFLICPPFLASKTKKNADTRLQQKPGERLFVIHVDEQHTVDLVRFWTNGKLNQPLFNCVVAGTLNDNNGKDFLKENYGNWENIAKKIADIVMGCIDLMKPEK
ncbi:MAG: hypothetical protein HOO67_03210 [Candidatus Peribacteraceae bacterium]|nr:hypothetical protein [Candidatus Peribacteraceae bacterium]